MRPRRLSGENDRSEDGETGDATGALWQHSASASGLSFISRAGNSRKTQSRDDLARTEPAFGFPPR